MGKIRVIVAEGPADSSKPNGLLRTILEQEGVEVAGEVTTFHELVQLAADEQPDAVVFADEVPPDELARLRHITPNTKIVLVTPILTAAEAELASAVVERPDVLRSLGPVLVLLCTPGSASARRGLTRSFDRPDWIDRVRKDPVTLREILGAPSRDEAPERPSVTSLQGEARDSAPRDPLPEDDDVVTIPEAGADLEEVVRLPGSDIVPDGRKGADPRSDAGPSRRRARWWTVMGRRRPA